MGLNDEIGGVKHSDTPVYGSSYLSDFNCFKTTLKSGTIGLLSIHLECFKMSIKRAVIVIGPQ